MRRLGARAACTRHRASCRTTVEEPSADRLCSQSSLQTTLNTPTGSEYGTSCLTLEFARFGHPQARRALRFLRFIQDLSCLCASLVWIVHYPQGLAQACTRRWTGEQRLKVRRRVTKLTVAFYVLVQAMQLFGFAFVGKSAPLQKAGIIKFAKKTVAYGRPFALLLFPEGTLFSRLTRPKSASFAATSGVVSILGTLL